MFILSVETMDHHKKKNNKILNPFSQSYSSIKILLTLPLFCILFSYSLFSSLFSTFSMKLLSYYYSADRNYIFLLCNGILILIIKNSGLFAIAPSNNDHFRDNSNVQSHQSNGFNVKKNTRLNPFSHVSSQTNAEEITKAVVEVDKAENVTLIEEKEEVDELLNIVEEEEGIGLLSRDELNKKCEEFIRKMKYGIKFEAQHHLIMVK